MLFVYLLTALIGLAESEPRILPTSATSAFAKTVFRQMAWLRHPKRTKEDLEKALIFNIKLSPASSEPTGPVNLPLKEFKKLDPVTIFLMKRRMDTPRNYTQVEGEDLIRGRRNVAVGVVLEGRVERLHTFLGDGDIVFDVSKIHCEITPNWDNKYPVTKPKDGDLVRVYGWTYYDIFHEDEGEDERERNRGRPTVWEIHPVHKIEIIR